MGKEHVEPMSEIELEAAHLIGLLFAGFKVCGYVFGIDRSKPRMETGLVLYGLPVYARGGQGGQDDLAVLDLINQAGDLDGVNDAVPGEDPSPGPTPDVDAVRVGDQEPQVLIAQCPSHAPNGKGEICGHDHR